MDVDALRMDFPVLRRTFNGKPLAYLDNAASTQKPESVIQAVSDFYSASYSNVHRSVSSLSMEATQLFEAAREKVASFLKAKAEEVIFTRNATESLNLVAQAWGRHNLRKGDVVVVTEMDHHSNLVPWQQVAREAGAKLEFVPVTDQGELDDSFEFPEATRVFSFAQVSNVLGTVNDVKAWTKKARKQGALVVVDGAAGAPHGLVDVFDADFYAFSGHKMCGPMGAGVLWGKKSVLEEMPPFLFGGSMISKVKKEGTTWAELPAKFEAGTPNAADAIGLSRAVDYLQRVGFSSIQKHEEKLLKTTLDLLSDVPGVTVYGSAKARTPIVSFNLAGAHTHDVGSILDANAIAVRSGNHCAQVLMDRLNIAGATRASFYLYNTEDECHRLADAVKQAQMVFA
ncbi:SufS family cysteine desulfurase [Candidatus Micrarchaeota archaeon]|nr:SufS family cysteine desulfurase [Candidatus Micrarchaeota archaeon]